MQAVFNLLAGAVRDSKDKVKSVGIEGLAVLYSRIGKSEFDRMLARSSLAEDDKESVRMRLDSPALCSVNADGMVEHLSDVAASAEDGLGRADARAQQAGAGEIRYDTIRDGMGAACSAGQSCTVLHCTALYCAAACARPYADMHSGQA